MPESNPTGMRPVEECEHGGLDARDNIAGPQPTGCVARGKFGGNNADTAPLGPRGVKVANSYEGPKRKNGRQLSGRR